MKQDLGVGLSYELIPWMSSRYQQVRDTWARLATLDAQAPIFCRREWFELGYRCGAIQPWGVLLVSAGHPVALFPLVRQFPGSWEVPSFFGAGDLQILVDPVQEALAWQGMVQWVRHGPPMSVLTLGITERRDRIDSLIETCQRYGVQAIVEPYPTTVIWSELPASWETFLAQIGSNAARNIRRAEKKLRDLGSACSIELLTGPEECAQLIPDLIRLYRQRWEPVTMDRHFKDPHNGQFYQQAVSWAAEQGAAMVLVMRNGEKIALVQTMFRLPGQPILYQHYTARDTAALPHQYSPGVVGSAIAFRWAIEQGLTRINQGPVNMPYKEMFGGVELPRWKVTLARSLEAYRLMNTVGKIQRAVKNAPVFITLQTRNLQQRLRKHEREA